MKLEVGMYVRYKRGSMGYIEPADKIGKIINIIFESDIYELDNNNSIFESDVVKASYNIIDILEEGDYVNGYYVSKIWEKDEITHYVDGTPIKRKQREIVIQAPNYGGIEILKNKNIKSIVTKEQFEQMSYKVGE